MGLGGLNEILVAFDDIPDTESGRIFARMLLEVVGSAFACAAPNIVTTVFVQLECNLRRFNSMVAEVVDK